MLNRRAALWFAFFAVTSFLFAAPAKADEDADRAAALKQYGLTLESCIKKASDEAEGVAVFANVHIGKRGNFGVNVDCMVGGQRTGMGVDQSGKVSKKDRLNRDRGNENDYPKIAQEFTDQKVTLADLVRVAEQESKGTAINAWGFIKDGQVLVRVIVVAPEKNDQGVMEERSRQLVIDPRTRKVK